MGVIMQNAHVLMHVRIIAMNMENAVLLMNVLAKTV